MCNESSRAISSTTYVPAVACSEAEDYDVFCNSEVSKVAEQHAFMPVDIYVYIYTHAYVHPYACIHTYTYLYYAVPV